MLDNDRMRPIATHPVNRNSMGRKKKRRINKRRKNKKRQSVRMRPEHTKMYEKGDRYTYLFRYRAVLSYFSDYYELTTVHIAFMVAAYSTEYFIADELCEALLIPYSWRRRGFNELVKKNLIKVYIHGNRKEGELDVYKLTNKGSLAANRFYRMLHGELEIPDYY